MRPKRLHVAFYRTGALLAVVADFGLTEEDRQINARSLS